MIQFEELQVRAALFGSIRSFFRENQFLEVDTPVRMDILIPESTIQPLLSGDHFLQTSPELYMKRLLATGCERIFQIAKCFRKEEQGRHHLEEFTLLEWYRCQADYRDLMHDCQEMLQYLVRQLPVQIFGAVASGKLPLLKDTSFSFDLPWQRISVQQAFMEWSSVSLEKALREGCFDEILVEQIEPRLGDTAPVFLYDYPISLASLARKKEGAPEYAERFELYIKGVELANGFSELTDADEQRARFDFEIEAIGDSFGRKMEMPELFLTDLSNIGEAAGIAFGVDRLLMLLRGKTTIEDVVPFAGQDV